jgi:hypothetical protein
MALLTPLTVNGRSYPAAYVKATVATSSAQNTVLKLQAWETQELREQDVPSLPYPNDLRMLLTVALPAANPVDYGYQLLEASGEFPDATWNV